MILLNKQSDMYYCFRLTRADFLTSAIRMAEFRGRLLADGLTAYLLPHSDCQQPAVRAEDHGPACSAVLPRQLRVRVGRVPVRPARRHRLHDGARRLRTGQLPVPGDRPRADRREP